MDNVVNVNVCIVTEFLFACEYVLYPARAPDTGSGLLVLMGISHSAYLGNKIPDKPPNEAADKPV